MPTGYQIVEQDRLHFLTLQVVYWVDIFTRKQYKDIVIDSLRYCQQHKGLAIYGYVIMSNHIHLLAKSDSGSLSATLRDFKKFTSKAIVAAVQAGEESRAAWMLRLFSHAAKRQNKDGSYQLWTHENHAELIYSNKFIRQKLTYIHNNPVRAGIVERPEEYLYSSARCYAELDTPLTVQLVEMLW